MVDESSSSSYLPSAFLRRGQGVTRAVSAREGLLSCALVCVFAVVLPRRRTARDFSVSGGDPSLEAPPVGQTLSRLAARGPMAVATQMWPAPANSRNSSF